MKKILLTIIVILVLGSCRSTYQSPNDIYRRNSDFQWQSKWYDQKTSIVRVKTIHHPRWKEKRKR